MLMNPFDIPLGWLLSFAVVVILAWFGWVEYHAHLLKTQVTQTGGVLRFDAHGWSISVNRAEQQLAVQARYGHLNQQPLAGGQAQVQQGAIAATLPAAGLRIDVLAGATSGTRVVALQASDAMAFAAQGKAGGAQSVLRIDNVPAPVAAQFGAFANQLRVWVDKLEQRMAAQLQADASAAEAQQKADAAEAGVEPVPEVPKEMLSAEVQVALWTKAAGFTGTFSEIGLSDNGGVDWYVDLGPTGRITLHSNGRTAHTTLAGAEIASVGGEIEVAVRADDWTVEEPVMRRFRVLTGRPPDERRAWKERMEILRDELRNAAGLQA
jgi:transposase-like protein